MSFAAAARFFIVIGPQPFCGAISGCLQTPTVLMTQRFAVHAFGHFVAVMPANSLATSATGDAFFFAGLRFFAAGGALVSGASVMLSRRPVNKLHQTFKLALGRRVALKQPR